MFVFCVRRSARVLLETHTGKQKSSNIHSERRKHYILCLVWFCFVLCKDRCNHSTYLQISLFHFAILVRVARRKEPAPFVTNIQTHIIVVIIIKRRRCHCDLLSEWIYYFTLNIDNFTGSLLELCLQNEWSSTSLQDFILFFCLLFHFGLKHFIARTHTHSVGSPHHRDRVAVKSVWTSMVLNRIYLL